MHVWHFHVHAYFVNKNLQEYIMLLLIIWYYPTDELMIYRNSYKIMLIIVVLLIVLRLPNCKYYATTNLKKNLKLKMFFEHSPLFNQLSYYFYCMAFSGWINVICWRRKMFHFYSPSLMYKENILVHPHASEVVYIFPGVKKRIMVSCNYYSTAGTHS